MGNESFPITPQNELTPEQAEQDQILRERFGSSYEEGQQHVEVVGKWSGTYAQMLLDPECPVGAQVESVYKETLQKARDEGVNSEEEVQKKAVGAVQEKLDSLKSFFPTFSVEIGERFKAKKKLNQPKI